MENQSSFQTAASRRGGNRGENNNWVTRRQGRRSSTNPPADKTLSPSSESCHGDVVNLWIRAKTGRKESCSINSSWTAVTVTFLIGKSMRGCYGSLLAWISFFRSILIGGPLKTFVRIHTKSLVIQFYVQWFWFLLDLSISSLTYFWTAFHSFPLSLWFQMSVCFLSRCHSPSPPPLFQPLQTSVHLSLEIPGTNVLAKYFFQI